MGLLATAKSFMTSLKLNIFADGSGIQAEDEARGRKIASQ